MYLRTTTSSVICSWICPSRRPTSSDFLKSLITKIPVGRLGTVEEISRTVTFLASEDAGFITGSTITANGGQYFI